MGDLVAMLIPILRLSNKGYALRPAPSEDMPGFAQERKGCCAFC